MNEIINQKHYKRFSIIFIMMVLISFFDVLSIGSIIPLLTLINESSNNTDGINYLANSLLKEYSYNEKILFISTFILIFFLIKNLITIINTKVISNYLLFFSAELQQRLFEKFIYTNYSNLIKNTSQKYIRDITIETRLIVNSYLSPIFQIIINLITILFFFILLIIYNPKVTIIVLISISIVSLLLIFILKPIIYKFGKIRQDATGKIIGYIKQTYDGIRELKLDHSENFYLNDFKTSIEKLASIGVSRAIYGILPKIIFESLFVFLFVVFIFFSLHSSFNLSESILTLTIYGASALRIIPSANNVIRSYQKVNYAKSALDAVKNYLEKNNIESNENLSSENTQIIYSEFKSSINLKNINFSYDRKKILENLNLQIEKNKFYVLKGDTGSGKSTLVDIICGLQKANSGKIFIDDKDVNLLNKNWSNKISYIQQNPYIFNLSLAKNISISKNLNEEDYQKIEEIINKVGLSEFVKNLDLGINTLLLDKGLDISGGQKQKISIARALYKDKEIIILDETLSNLDKESKFEILNVLNKFKTTKTIIMISHDEDVLQYADKILLLKDKKIYYET